MNYEAYPYDPEIEEARQAGLDIDRMATFVRDDITYLSATEPDCWFGHYNNEVDRWIFEILDRYFHAAESGDVDRYHPSTSFRADDERVELLMAEIDNEFEIEIALHPRTWAAFDGPPGFGDMPMEAKRAMYEELKQLLC